jgi:hypothetical protein
MNHTRQKAQQVIEQVQPAATKHPASSKQIHLKALSMRPPAALVGATMGRVVGGDEALLGEGGEGVVSDLEGAFEGAGGGNSPATCARSA